MLASMRVTMAGADPCASRRDSTDGLLHRHAAREQDAAVARDLATIDRHPEAVTLFADLILGLLDSGMKLLGRYGRGRSLNGFYDERQQQLSLPRLNICGDLQVALDDERLPFSRHELMVPVEPSQGRGSRRREDLSPLSPAASRMTIWP